jgi:hypothetical protein
MGGMRDIRPANAKLFEPKLCEYTAGRLRHFNNEWLAKEGVQPPVAAAPKQQDMAAM